MAPTPRDNLLIGRYFDGLASADELAALQQRVREDAAVADALAEAGRMDGWLSAYFREEKGMEAAAALVRQIEAARPPEDRRGAGGRKWPVPPRVVAAAALVLLVGGAGLWLALRDTTPSEPHVLSGHVLADGALVTRVPEGAAVRVGDAGSAVIRLTDGSRATFDAASEAVLHGRTEARRQLVELRDGGGLFEVAKDGGSFEVRTPLGRVTALGTAFTVRLLAGPEGEREGPKAGRGHGGLLVAVRAGAVEVEFAGRTHVLRGGQSRRFAREGEPEHAETTWAGRLAQVEADAVTVVRKSEKAEDSRRIRLDADTRILVETGEMEVVVTEGGRSKQRIKVAAGSPADLRVGQNVTVTCTGDGTRALKVLVRRTPPPKAAREREGEEPAPVRPRGGRESGNGDHLEPREKPAKGPEGT